MYVCECNSYYRLIVSTNLSTHAHISNVDEHAHIIFTLVYQQRMKKKKRRRSDGFINTKRKEQHWECIRISERRKKCRVDQTRTTVHLISFYIFYLPIYTTKYILHHKSWHLYGLIIILTIVIIMGDIIFDIDRHLLNTKNSLKCQAIRFIIRILKQLSLIRRRKKKRNETFFWHMPILMIV